MSDAHTNRYPALHNAMWSGLVGKGPDSEPPNGKLDIVRGAGAWLRVEKGEPLRVLQHMCWDGCMFPNPVMFDHQTWNDVLRVMVAVRDAHGWN